MIRTEVIMEKIAYLDKQAGFTQHGKDRQIARAKGYSHYSDRITKATEEYPGMGYLKGSPSKAVAYKLMARRNAYQSEGTENQLKAMIPFVGMGPKGREALDKLSYLTQHGKKVQEARALAYDELATGKDIAEKNSPGMGYLKGTFIEPPIHRLWARHEAYRAQGRGKEMKSLIPLVGMGAKGQEALNKLKSNQ